MRKKLTSGILILVLCATMSSMPISAAGNNDMESLLDTNFNDTEIIENVVQAMNDKNVSKYIDLFDENNQISMNQYLLENGSDDFFQAEETTILDIKELSYETGLDAAKITKDELMEFADIRVIYVKEQVRAKLDSDVLKDGIDYKAYVIGTENGMRKILRISGADVDSIINNEENFGNEEMGIQPCASTSLTSPAIVTVYFTKSENKTYHGNVRADINFTTYLKRVIPNEWIVSYYSSYPAYLRAGAMASKMYAWYHVVHPKWNYSPYYADLKDNSSDQNYLATSYSALSSTYQSYVNSTLSTIGTTAMTKSSASSNSSLFESQYHATSGSKGSGMLNASKAYSLAKSGYTYKEILQYFYNYSDNAGGNAIVFQSHLVGTS